MPSLVGSEMCIRDSINAEYMGQAKKPRRLPVVLTEDEVRDVLANLDGVHWLVAALLYGAQKCKKEERIIKKQVSKEEKNNKVQAKKVRQKEKRNKNTKEKMSQNLSLIHI
eukprot:TRINITY_DN5054_c0_g1_i2.p5 TRINITY_DN5054_c0_g1~~TRINITY_DN5054_c0_g1_i2.p5  ORF type:complete len:111 (-),score=32.29 TRINITY_DN5054_c0_g1_i2:167-499(-)